MSTRPLEAAGIAGEVFAEYEEKTGGENTREYLTEDGPLYGYQCLHCGKYHLWVDAD